jgi:hypothetical protein
MSLESGKHQPSEEEIKEAERRMSTLEKTMSKHREQDIRKELHKEEDKFLGKSQLRLLEHEVGSSQFSGFEGTIDNKQIKVWMDRAYPGKVFGIVDGMELDTQLAGSLFDKFYSIAEVQSKSQNWESDDVRAEAAATDLFNQSHEELTNKSELRLRDANEGQFGGFEGSMDGKEVNLWINSKTRKVEGTIDNLAIPAAIASRKYDTYKEIAEKQEKEREEAEKAKKDAGANDLLNL